MELKYYGLIFETIEWILEFHKHQYTPFNKSYNNLIIR